MVMIANRKIQKQLYQKKEREREKEKKYLQLKRFNEFSTLSLCLTNVLHVWCYIITGSQLYLFSIVVTIFQTLKVRKSQTACNNICNVLKKHI